MCNIKIILEKDSEISESPHMLDVQIQEITVFIKYYYLVPVVLKKINCFAFNWVFHFMPKNNNHILQCYKYQIRLDQHSPRGN